MVIEKKCKTLMGVEWRVVSERFAYGARGRRRLIF